MSLTSKTVAKILSSHCDPDKDYDNLQTLSEIFLNVWKY